MSELFLQNTTMVDGSIVDIRIQGEKIVEIGPSLTPSGDLIDCTGLRALPGFVDLHTHLREPGKENAETVLSGSQSAVRGGFTALSAMANTTVCDKPDFGFNATEDDLIDWVIDRCRSRGAKIEEQAAVVLTTRVGANTGQLDSELAKLVTSAAEGSMITEQLVRDLVPFTRAGGIFDLSDAINKRNLPLCIDTLQQLRRQGESVVGILLAAIVPTVRNLLIAKDLMERHKIRPPAQANYFASDLKRLRSEETAHLPRKKDGTLNSYGIGLAAMNAARFDRDHLVSAFLACRDANAALLRGQGAEDTLLTQLLVRIVAKKA